MDRVPITKKFNDAQLNRFVQSSIDFQHSLSAVTFLQEDCDFDQKYNHVQLRRFRCYESSAIVYFGRPFVKSKGHEVLGFDRFGIKLTKKEKILKDQVLDLRNKMVAHVDVEKMHFRINTHFIDSPDMFVPEVRFNEGLLLNQQLVEDLEDWLIAVRHQMNSVIWNLAQTQPQLLERYIHP